MKSSWIFLCVLSLSTWLTVQGTYTYGGSDICQCNGKSRYCLPDSGGLHCVDCQGNTEGRHCEKCKEGFHHQRAGDSCLPCLCSPVGSVGSRCDSEGRCRCKAGVKGEKCDQCLDGTPITSEGCSAHGGQLSDSAEKDRTLPCFCYGHSTKCSPATGYSAYAITSTFDDGLEGWRAAPAEGGSSSQVRFRWSHTHRDLEVISKDLLPVYLYAPDSYLGNQELSYGQNLSFSLRLDRGIRHPSTADVVLEGSGQKVAAPLGDLRNNIRCGQRITYTFRLDEQPSSKWTPQLSPFQFQTLLQNLTAIKIRGTFGENARGYLDNVRLESARQGPGVPAPWVQMCTCPEGSEGLFCEKCAVGYTRSSPSRGPFSSCKPCNCRGGTCDPETGDCFSADETPGQDNTCPSGYYNDPVRPGSCRKCPCLSGASCTVSPITREVQCDRCPSGTTGLRCNICQDGFFGDPQGEYGFQAPCQPCDCNGHADPNAVRSCDPQTGKCLKCVNHTTGYFCDRCLEGYYHNMPSEECKPCSCNPRGSQLKTCSNDGQCLCKEGFEGLKCLDSTCPSCFNNVKYTIEGYTSRLEEIKNLFTGMESGRLPGTDTQMEKMIKDAEDRVYDLQTKAQKLSESEKLLQGKVSEISTDQLTNERAIAVISQTIGSIKLLSGKHDRQVSNVNTLINAVRRNLQEAKRQIDKAELPSSDTVVGTENLSTLVERANDLAERHQSIAGIVVKTANSALAESEMSLMNMRSVMLKENRTKQLIGDLKAKYDADLAQVKAMDTDAARLSISAENESKEAANALKRIASLERKIPGPLTDAASVLARLDGMKEQVTNNLKEYQALQDETQEDTAAVKDLLIQGDYAQKKYKGLLEKANAAKDDSQKALKSITDNINGVDDILNTLKDDERQISMNKDLADDAINKFSGINRTIQQAVGSNQIAQFIIDSVSVDYDEALDTISSLGTGITQLEKMSANLQVPTGLLNNTTKLYNDVQDLKDQARSIDGKVLLEKDNAERQKENAAQSSMKATGAYNYAKDTRGDVADTLLAVNDLLSMFGDQGSVDEKKLEELERSVAGARVKVNRQLKPRLQQLDEMEAGQKAKLSGLIVDIDMILADIKNLEMIKNSIPKGCYNAQPIENP
ncbi:laminin subunit gamma-2 [Esox lucius]|uniref:Laminin, gamma 2 n=1 Tax=Esox lucius TaxID=8010 RepID=A0A3P8Y159_ESOLU|nr:laminin subunit gamma-2 [Esox lucius]